MKSLAVLVVVVAVVGAESLTNVVRDEWNAFKLEHKKSYKTETEEKFRMKIFVENKLDAEKHNRRFERGQETYRLGTNKYSDLLHHEFVHMIGFNHTANKNLSALKEGLTLRGATFLSPTNLAAPKTMDWRTEGLVTEIKDQGSCGSGWAFSATGSLEGQQFRSSGTLVSLSEQNLIDCSKNYENNGCKGGSVPHAFTYIRDNGGIDTDESYPYEEDDEDKCRYNPRNVGAKVSGFVDLPKGNEKKLMDAVSSVGPVSVTIDASQPSFQKYTTGIYYDSRCSSTRLNHAVLVVGYGYEEVGGDYWLIKNSWGRSWGMLGYMKLARNRDNHCGIASAASYPLV
ncbi:procathepsin L-like isoform X4 [Vanessa atalanta]|uniref:procathepsin L-like isoform X4 n=1 Tax=Vanessa atalanta TaxID=42275 RepID=UPI001FCDDC94|nr:procathepsin L-like isoform X4 [Vanessa atalanta]